MTRKPTDTTGQAHEFPLATLAALSGASGVSAGIERMEADGQVELVSSEVIPTKLRGFTEADLQALGFTLGPVDRSDPLFRPATLPPGWAKRSTDHSMWSKIVDDKGRERFSIFYKAAYYDRSAHMDAVPRFGYAIREPGSTPDRYAAVVKDDTAIVATLGEWSRDDYAAGDAILDKCVAWLDERRPDWRNPMAYWD